MKNRFVITAGPTREHLDPVRFLSNPSTGKMGFAIAAEAARRGHETVLVAGPVALKTPKGVRRVDVVSAREMLAAVEDNLFPDGSPSAVRRSDRLKSSNQTILISTAAVADWRPAKCAVKKLKKDEMSPTLRLVRNPDILRSVKGVKKIGFAAETDHVLAEAARKCREKGLSFIVANDVTKQGSGFGTDTNEVTFVYPNGTRRKFPLMTKHMVAKRIVDAAETLGC